jgi:hypothetical protein
MVLQRWTFNLFKVLYNKLKSLHDSHLYAQTTISGKLWQACHAVGGLLFCQT